MRGIQHRRECSRPEPTVAAAGHGRIERCPECGRAAGYQSDREQQQADDGDAQARYPEWRQDSADGLAS